MRHKLSIVLLSVFINLVAAQETQSQFAIDAQLRNRMELRDGYQKLASIGDVLTVFISQRTRISFAYESEKLKFKITPQDVRLWGGDLIWSSSGIASNTSIGLFEGYAEVKLGKVGWVSAGRQQLKYDNERILATRNWNQNGLTYDALVFKMIFSDWKLHFGSSWNSLSETSRDNLYPSGRIKSYNFLWINHQFNDMLNLSLLHVASGVTQTDTTNTLNFRQTTGLYAVYKNDKLSLWVNAYYQFGKNQKGTDVSAYLFDADASYKISNLTLGIGLGYLSGNTKIGTEQTTDNLFDKLYGANHKYFGYLDYFRSFSSHTNQAGLADYYVNFSYQFSKSFSLRNIGHYFQLAQRNTTTPIDKNLGYENDLVFNYKFSDWGALESGYLFFLPTESLKTIQGVSKNKFSQFFYLQLTLTPVLFKQESR